MRQTFAIGIGGAAGQGVATPGDIFAKIFNRNRSGGSVETDTPTLTKNQPCSFTLLPALAPALVTLKHRQEFM
jgi:hypothetical protein